MSTLKRFKRPTIVCNDDGDNDDYYPLRPNNMVYKKP